MLTVFIYYYVSAREDWTILICHQGSSVLGKKNHINLPSIPVGFVAKGHGWRNSSACSHGFVAASNFEQRHESNFLNAFPAVEQAWLDSIGRLF